MTDGRRAPRRPRRNRVKAERLLKGLLLRGVFVAPGVDVDTDMLPDAPAGLRSVLLHCLSNRMTRFGIEVRLQHLCRRTGSSRRRRSTRALGSRVCLRPGNSLLTAALELVLEQQALCCATGPAAQKSRFESRHVGCAG